MARLALRRGAQICALLVGLALPQGARAADECGTGGPAVSCGPGSFNSGITYDGPFAGGFGLTSIAGTDTTFIAYSGEDHLVALLNQGAINSVGPLYGLNVTANSGKIESVAITNAGQINAGLGAGITLSDQTSNGQQGAMPSFTVDNPGSIVATGGGMKLVMQHALSVTNDGSISVAAGHGIEVYAATKTATTITIGSEGPIFGSSGRYGGIWVHAENDAFTAEITVDDRVDMNGAGAIGVWLTGGNSHTVTIDSSGILEGGWGTGPKGELSAGILTDGGVKNVTVTILGSLRALSDRAIADLADTGGQTVIRQGGVMLGFVQLGGGGDAITLQQGAAWGLRNYADSDGDGTRDLEGVAIADFGGESDLLQLDVRSRLGLATVPGGGLDTAGMILSPDGFGDIVAAGVEQGHIIGLETFSNGGIVTLMDAETGGSGAVPGDILVITGLGKVSEPGPRAPIEYPGLYLSDGGELRLDTYLDAGLADNTDLLVVDSTKLGKSGLPTRVFIANAGGPGGETGSGPTDGIMIVQVRGDSDPAAFTLGGPVIAGAYEYGLKWADQQNWYLQSTLTAEVETYPAAVIAAVTAWFADLRPLHERMGTAREQLMGQGTAVEGAVRGHLAALGASDTQQAVLPGAGGRSIDSGWIRVTGDYIEIDSGADFAQTTIKGEAGYDLGIRDLMAGGDLLLLGGFAGLGDSEVDFDDDTTVDYAVYTAGLYATYGRGGFFLDGVIKGDWLDGTYNGLSTGGADADYDALVLGASVEVGYRQDLFAGALFVEPQAQLSYAHNWSGDFDDASGATVELEDGDTLRGRLGGRVGTTVMAGRTALGFYLEGNVLHDFFGTQAATVSGLTFEQDPAGTAVELGAGFRVTDAGGHLALFVDGDYVTGEDQRGFNLVAGLRLSW